MKTKHLLLIALFVGSFGSMSGQAYKSAIGVKGGNVLLGTFKTFLGEKLAFEGVTGFGLGVDADLYGSAFLQLHFPIGSVDNLSWFVGAGPGFATAGILDEGTNITISGIGGVDWRLGDTPWNFSADITAPVYLGDTILDFVPYLSVAARYIFKDTSGS